MFGFLIFMVVVGLLLAAADVDARRAWRRSSRSGEER